MKIEVISKDSFSIFINSLYVDITDYTNKDKLVEVVKNVIKKMKNRLNLRGFYKIKVFVQEQLGLFLEVVKLEDLDYSNALDLRVIVFLDEKIYFETDDYFVIENIKKIRYHDNKYYCCVEDFNDIFPFLEFGRFIYGNEVIRMLNNSVIL